MLKDINPRPLTKADLILFMKKQTNQPIDLLLTPIQSVSVNQALKDFRREKVIFNGVPFIPDSIDQYRSEAFVATLQEYAKRLIKIAPECCVSDFSHDPHKISDLILQNSCRTSAGADSFFILQDLFRIEGTILSQKTGLHEDPAILIDLQLESTSAGHQELISVVKVWNFFAIYDSEAMENLPTDDSEPVPWLELEAIVVDIFNFKTRERSRRMELITYMPSKMKYFHPAFSPAAEMLPTFKSSYPMHPALAVDEDYSSPKKKLDENSDVSDYKKTSLIDWLFRKKTRNSNIMQINTPDSLLSDQALIHHSNEEELSIGTRDGLSSQLHMSSFSFRNDEGF